MKPWSRVSSGIDPPAYYECHFSNLCANQFGWFLIKGSWDSEHLQALLKVASILTSAFAWDGISYLKE
jgi:hypothetical protein